MSDLEEQGKARESPCFSAPPLVRPSWKHAALPGMMSWSPEKGALLPPAPASPQRFLPGTLTHCRGGSAGNPGPSLSA